MHTHNDTVIDQFTRQADAFAAARPIRDEQALDLLVAACRAAPGDAALDVACGPGLVACAFAEVVRTVVGIDLTPAMLDKGRALAAEKNLGNVSFRTGDVNALPFKDASFSIVTSRYAFHHFTEPARVLREMTRVCTPGGCIAVMDMVASDDPAKAALFNTMETLRHPSHAGALTQAAMLRCFADAGLPVPAVTPCTMKVELEALLATSFPEEGDRETVRQIVTASVADDAMGVGSYAKDGRVYFSYPIAIFVSRKLGTI